jgi:hypothetical protein
VKTTAQLVLVLDAAVRFECTLVKQSELHEEKSSAFADPAASVGVA